MMSNDYSPTQSLDHPFSDPILYREIMRFDWRPELYDIRKVDWTRLSNVILLQSALIIALVVSSSFDTARTPTLGVNLTVLVILVFIFGPVVVSVIIDVYMASMGVNFWHRHTLADTLDVLRLTRPTDDELLVVLRAAAELSVWRAMRWDMALRGFGAFWGIGICVIGAMIMLLVMLSIMWSPDAGGQLLLQLVLMVWSVRMLMMYVREPLWRLRVLVAMSIAIAEHIRETNMAILITCTAAIGLKLAHVMVLITTLVVSLTVGGSSLNRGIAILWLLVSSLLMTRLVRRAYAGLHQWCTDLTLHNLNGEGSSVLHRLQAWSGILWHRQIAPESDAYESA